MLEGIVVLNDRSGNARYAITVQDASAGIEILLDRSYLHTDFPVGRRVYILCKGLYKSAPGAQLGYGAEASGLLRGIPAPLINDYVVGGGYPYTVVPDTFGLRDLQDKAMSETLVHRKIAIRDVEIGAGQEGLSYAPPAQEAAYGWLSLEDCSGHPFWMRTSSQASFRAALPPSGSGTLVAVYKKDLNRAYLVLQDTVGWKADAPPCQDRVRTWLRPDLSMFMDGERAEPENWSCWSPKGKKPFLKGADGEKDYWRITAFGGGPVPDTVETWMISPRIDLSGKQWPRLVMATKDSYDNGATLKVMWSTDYPGSGPPMGAFWRELDLSVSHGHNTGRAADWTRSALRLPPSGPVCLAFVYHGGKGRTTTFDLADVWLYSE